MSMGGAMVLSRVSAGGGRIEGLLGFLPRGGMLPAQEWRRRHRALLALLWVNVAALSFYGVVLGKYGGLHDASHGLPLAAFAVLAGNTRFSPKGRSVFVSLGLLTAAALLVHLTGGLIEAHFYFFVLIVALTVYEDWLPFLAAVAYVLLHHGIVGTLDPHQVYNRPEAWADPWFWAGVHALFVAFAGIAGVLAWRLNEDVRDRCEPRTWRSRRWPRRTASPACPTAERRWQTSQGSSRKSPRRTS